jgi:hypothetical protein
MADPVQIASKFFYVGALIANPPIVGGTTLVPASNNNGNIAYVFTQPTDRVTERNASRKFFGSTKIQNPAGSTTIFRSTTSNRLRDSFSDLLKRMKR